MRFSGCMLVLSLLTPLQTLAGQIGREGFSPHANVQDFESLGPYTTDYNSSLLIGSDTFEGDDHLLRSSKKFGESIGRTGVALSNNPSASASPIGFIEVVLGAPALRAGLYVGEEKPWSAQVSFYAAEDVFLGDISLSGSGNSSGFAGWQAEGMLVHRIRVTDGTNDVFPIIIDDFIYEVPEPSVLGFCVFTVVTSLLARRHSDARKEAPNVIFQSTGENGLWTFE